MRATPPRYTDASLVAEVTATPLHVPSPSTTSSFAACQREVLALRSELEASHAREVHLYEQLVQRDVCCNEQWPSLFLQYANSQRQLLLQQHSDVLRYADELFVTFQDQHTRAAKAHAYEIERLASYAAQSRERVRSRTEAEAAQMELGLAQTALETQQHVKALQTALHSTQSQLERALAERDDALARVAQLEHHRRVSEEANKAMLQQQKSAFDREKQTQWIACEALRQSYDALFTSWAAAQGLCDTLTEQQRLRNSQQSSGFSASLDSVLCAAEEAIRTVCVHAVPAPLFLAEEEAIEADAAARPVSGMTTPSTDPAAVAISEQTDTLNIYGHVRMCAQLHALLSRSVRVLNDMQRLQDEWVARLQVLERHGWEPRVARKVLGQDFAARLDRVVHTVEATQPPSTSAPAIMPAAPPSLPPRHPPTTVRAKKRPAHSVSALPDQVKPRFAF